LGGVQTTVDTEATRPVASSPSPGWEAADARDED